MRLRGERRRLGWVGLVACFAAGCSSAPAWIPAQPMEASRFQEARGGVRVAVDPFFTAERIRRAFRGGEDFPGSGLLPVQVTIENGSGGDLQVNPREFRLVRPTGRADAPLSAYEAFALVRLSPGWWAAVPVLGTSALAVRNEPRLKDLESRELQPAGIAPGKFATGFIYFQIPETDKSLAGSRVVLVLKAGPRQELAFEIPIEGRRDIPAPSRPPDTARPQTTSRTTEQGLIRIEGAGGQGVIIRSPSPQP